MLMSKDFEKERTLVFKVRHKERGENAGRKHTFLEFDSYWCGETLVGPSRLELEINEL